MSTPRLDLPTVPENSTNPATPVNNALQRLDALVDTVLQAMDLTAPPATVSGDVGKMWVPAATATGAWSGHEGEIALCVGADQWLFLMPSEGKKARNLDDGNDYVFEFGAWAEWSSGGGGGSDVVTVSNPANVSGTVTLNFASKSRYVGKITLAANVTTLAFSNLPAAGNYAEYELHITQDTTGSRTFAIPASHKALGGSDTAVAVAANSVTVLTASTVDDGTTWRYAMQESA